MPIFGYTEFAQGDRQHAASLERLRGSVLGIHGTRYAQSLVDGRLKGKSLHGAVGGVASALMPQVEADLLVLKKMHIQPIFVFDGIRPFTKKNLSGSLVYSGRDYLKQRGDRERHLAKLRDSAWDLYEAAEDDTQYEHAFSVFDEGSEVPLDAVLLRMIRLFLHSDVQFMVAPFEASAQLVLLSFLKICHHIYASEEVLLFPHTERVLLSIDFSSRSLVYTSRPHLLRSATDTPGVRTALLDAALLAGSAVTGPGIPIPHSTYLRSALDLVREHGSAAHVLLARSKSPHNRLTKSNFIEAFTNLARAKALVEHAIVYTAGPYDRVVPLTVWPEFKVIHQRRDSLGGGDRGAASRGAADAGASRSAVDAGTSTSTAAADSTHTPPDSTHTPPASTNTPPDSAHTTSKRLLPRISTSPEPSRLESILAEQPCADLDLVFTPKLPDVVFLMLQRGLLSRSLAEALATQTIQVPAPATFGNSNATRSFFQHLYTSPTMGLFPIALYVLARSLNPAWLNAFPYLAFFWHENTRPIRIEAPVIRASHIDPASAQVVPLPAIEAEVHRQRTDAVDLRLALNAVGHVSLQDPAAAAADAASSKAHRSPLRSPTAAPAAALDKKDAIVANAFLRFLVFTQFLEPTLEHTALSQGLLAAVNTTKRNDRLQEPLFLAVHLLRSNSLHGAPLDYEMYSAGIAFSGGPSVDLFPTAPSFTSMSLIIRAMSLVDVVSSDAPYRGPLSRDILAFSAHVSASVHGLRSIIEATCADLFISGQAFTKKPLDDFSSLSLSLPFQAAPSIVLGIIFKSFIELVIQYSGSLSAVTQQAQARDPDLADLKTQIVALLQTAFPSVRSVANEIRRGFHFWSALLLAIRTITASPLPGRPRAIAEFMPAFEQADTLLQSFAL